MLRTKASIPEIDGATRSDFRAFVSLFIVFSEIHLMTIRMSIVVFCVGGKYLPQFACNMKFPMDNSLTFM